MFLGCSLDHQAQQWVSGAEVTASLTPQSVSRVAGA